MINPDKVESRLSSKIFKTITLYMLIVLCTFFGYIMIFQNVKDDAGDLGADGTVSPFTALIDNIISTETMNANLGFSVMGPDLDLDVNGNLKLNVSNSDFSANFDIVYNDNYYKFNAFKNSNLEESNTLFVAINDNSYKVDLGATDLDFIEIISKIDFSSLDLNINLEPFIEALERYTGFDFSDPNLLNNILAVLTEAEPTETETGYIFDVAFNSIRMLIGCDKEYNNLTLNVDLPKFDEYTIDFAIDSAVLNEDNFNIGGNPTGNEQDLTSILKIIENAKLDENTYAISGDLAVSYNEMNFAGNILAMVVTSGEKFVPYIRLNAEVEGVNAYIYLLDQTIYLNVDNLKFKFDLTQENIDEVMNFVESELGISLGLDEEAVATITYVLPALENISASWIENGFNIKVDDEIQIENVRLYNIIVEVLTKKDSEENILPDSLKLETNIDFGEGENKVTLNITNIEIGKKVDYLEDITINEGIVESVKVENGTAKLSEFIDLMPALDIAKVVMNVNNLTGYIDTKVLSDKTEISLNGEVKFDIQTMSMSANLTAEYDGLVVDFGLYLENLTNLKEIYLTLGGKTLKLDLEKANLEELLGSTGMNEDVSEIISTILEKLNINLDLENLDIKALVLEILQGLTVEESEDRLTLNVKYQGYEVKVEVLKGSYNIYNLEISPITIDNISITKLNLTNVEVNANNFALDTPNFEEVEDVTSLLDLVENAKLDENTYAISGDLAVSYNEMNFAGNILAMVVTSGEKFVPYIRLNAEVEGVNAYIYLLDQTIYLNVDNLKFKFDLTQENIDEVMNFVESELGISLGLDEEAVATITYVLPALENISASWIENGFNIKVDDEIQIENVRLYNIIVEVLTKKDSEENILPDSLKLETNIDFGEGENKVTLNITNIEIGKKVDYLEDITINEGIVESVKVENGTAKLSEFIDLMPALDIAKVVMNVNNLTGYIDTKVLSDKTEISLNGEVKFDIQTMSMSANLTAEYDGLVVDFGLYLENLTNLKEIYLTLGGKTLKLDLEKANLEELLGSTGMNEDVSEIISTILEKLNINLDLENLDIKALVLEILQGLTVEESEDRLTLNVKYQGYEVKVEVLKGSYNIYNLEISPITIDNISITKLNLTNVEVNANNFALDTPNFEEVEDVTSLLDLVENAKLDENTYAISGDLKVRYSTTSFYGNILAMLTMKEGKLVPYVRVYTTSMNLSTFIYLIDTTVYIDLQGLRIKADLNETTINEILDFVSSEFLTQEEQIPEETTESFEIIFPALKNISANWILNEDNLSGIQINVDDELYYTANAYFDSIVLQAFGVKGADGTILPTEIVLGANINDPNTTIYDDYEDYLLENETAVTSSKNFAVYLENVEIGKNANYQDSIVFDEVSGTVTSLMGNAKNENNFYTLEEFNDYSVLLESFKVVKDYIFSYQYQINLNASLGETAISGDINVDVTDAEETEVRDDIFELFGGKNLQVQGDLSLVMSGVQHLISILYDSDERDASGQFNENYGGLYISYSHGDYITSGDIFRGRIKNANMSEMISFILGFANIELGDETMESWHLEKSQTDFSYIQYILGITGEDVSDDISEVDSLLGNISAMLEMLHNINLSKTLNSETGLYTTTFEVELDIEGNIGSVVIVLNEEIEDSIIVNKIRELRVSNIKVGEQFVNATIKFEDFDSANFDYFTANPAENHFDLSNLPEFMDIAVNTINTRGLNFKGSATVSILNIIDINVDIDMSVEFGDNGEISLVAEVRPEAIWALGFGTYVVTNAEGHKYTTNYSYDERVSVVTFKQDELGEYKLSIVQYNYKAGGWFSSEKRNVFGLNDEDWIYSMDELANGENIMKIMAQVLGMTDVTYEQIQNLIANMNPNPSLEKTILSFTKNIDANTNMTTGYTLGINGETLTGDANFDDFTMTVGLSEQYNGELRNYQFIDNISTTLSILNGFVKIPVNLASVVDDDNRYQTSSSTDYAGRDVFTNEYYRQEYIKTQVAA